MSARRRGLGKGLDALIRPEPQGSREVPIDRLEPNRFQPRSTFEEQGLEELAESIRVQGVIQPLVVSPRPDGRYAIIAGERRWRAAQRAGLDRVPVFVREVNQDQELLELALVENLQRADLNPIEEAEAYQSLRDQFQLSQEEIGRRVGKSRSAVANAVRLLRLPPEILDLLRAGKLTAGQARPLLAIQGAKNQIEMATRASCQELTARQVEAVAAKGKKSSRRSRETDSDGNTAAAEEALTRAFQTKVEIRRRGRGGTVQIHFHSEEELMRLYERFLDHGDKQ